MKVIDAVLFSACLLIIAVIVVIALPAKHINPTRGQIEYPFGVADYDSCKAEIELDQRVLALDFGSYNATTKSDYISTLYRFSSNAGELLLVCDNIRNKLVVSFQGEDVLNRLNGKFGFVGPKSEIALK